MLYFLENMVRPLTHGTRTGMRRLTGGRTREAERQRELFRAERAAPPQPVPKIPNFFPPKGQQQQGDML